MNYLRNFCLDIPEGEMVYPYVFPDPADGPAAPANDREPEGRLLLYIDPFHPLSAEMLTRPLGRR